MDLYLYFHDDCREPAWGTLPMAKVIRKEASAYVKAGSSLRRPPVPEHLPPKPESTHFTVLCSHLHVWLYRGLSPITSFGEGVNLQLQLIKIPGHDKSVSTNELLWRLSSLPVRVRPATWLFTASQLWEARDVLDLLKADSFRKLEIISIVGWLEIILVKGFSFVGPIFAAKSPYSLPL